MHSKRACEARFARSTCPQARHVCDVYRGSTSTTWHPHTRRFVLHERSELGECPIGVARALPPANRSPVTDALEVFQGDPAAGVFGGAHHYLADAVVRVALEARLLASQRLELPFGRACRAKKV